MFGGGLWSRHSGHEEESGILLSNLREAGQLDSDSQAWYDFFKTPLVSTH
jgi:hypothetical protein